MKKFLLLVFAIVTLFHSSVVSAQTSSMRVHKTDSVVDEYVTLKVDSVTFAFDSWEEYGVGDFAFVLWWYAPGGDYVTKPDLKVYRSTLHPNRYKIEKWGYDTDVDFYFTYDEETDVLAADEQDTGYHHTASGDDFGNVWVDELVHHWGEYDKSGYKEGQHNATSYKDGDVFNFSLIYWSGWGWLDYTGDWYDLGYETLTMTSYASDSPSEGGQSNVMEINHSDGSYTQYNVDEVDCVTFGTYQWDLIGTGTYTFADILYDDEENGLELWHNMEDITKWQISDFLEDGYPLTFTYDEETGIVKIPDQNTGYYTEVFVSGTTYYGYIWIEEANDLVDDYGSGFTGGLPNVDCNSYYDAETDTFYFAVGYYLAFSNKMVLYGYSGRYGKGYETFKVDNSSKVPTKKGPKLKISLPSEPILMER